MKGVKDTFTVTSEVDVDVDDDAVVREPSVNNRRYHRILSTLLLLFILYRIRFI